MAEADTTIVPDDDEEEESADIARPSPEGEESSSSSSTDQPPQHFNAHGRTYLTSNSLTPCDEAERTRLGLLHTVYTNALRGALLSDSLPNSVHLKSILDIGAGPGDWANAAAQRWPEAEITAADAGIWSSWEEDDEGVPENLEWVVVENLEPKTDDDDEDDDDEQWRWSFGDAEFDLVHVRGMKRVFTDWMRTYQEIWRVLKPGGYVQLSQAGEARTFLARMPALRELKVALTAAEHKRGFMFTRRDRYLDEGMLRQSAFAEIKSKTVEVPLGTWPENEKERAVGKMLLVCVLEGLEAESLSLLTSELGWTEERAKELCERAREELLAKAGERTMVDFRFVLARKPVDAD